MSGAEIKEIIQLSWIRLLTLPITASPILLLLNNLVLPFLSANLADVNRVIAKDCQRAPFATPSFQRVPFASTGVQRGSLCIFTNLLAQPKKKQIRELAQVLCLFQIIYTQLSLGLLQILLDQQVLDYSAPLNDD